MHLLWGTLYLKYISYIFMYNTHYWFHLKSLDVQTRDVRYWDHTPCCWAQDLLGVYLVRPLLIGLIEACKACKINVSYRNSLRYGYHIHCYDNNNFSIRHAVLVQTWNYFLFICTSATFDYKSCFIAALQEILPYKSSKWDEGKLYKGTRKIQIKFKQLFL